MAIHYSSKVERFENELQARYERLLSAIQGKEEIPLQDPSLPATALQRRVNASDVRLAVDDFASILKEIKVSFGRG